MIIKKARKIDANKISRLRRKTLKEINKNDYPKEHLKFLIEENSTRKIVNKITRRDLFCAWRGDELVGTIDLKGDKIGGLFVKSSEIGKGIGTRLMDFIENYARSKKLKKVRLYSTKFAVGFYRKRGYCSMPSCYWIIGKSRVRDKIMEKKL